MNNIIGTGTWTDYTDIFKIGSSGNSFIGSISDFRIYSRVLSDSEIYLLYSGLLYYSSLKVETYNQISSTLVSALPTIFSNDLTLNGQSFNNLTFNGQSYFEVANDGAFSPDLFTICTWVKNISSIGYQTIASCDNNLLNGWSVYIDNNNLEIWVGNSGINITICSVPLNTFYHLAISLNKYTNQLIVYINGILINSYLRTYINNTTGYLRIGCSSVLTNYLVNGSKLNDFRIYNRILSQNEIYNIYNNYFDNSTGPVSVSVSDGVVLNITGTNAVYATGGGAAAGTGVA